MWEMVVEEVQRMHALIPEFPFSIKIFLNWF